MKRTLFGLIAVIGILVIASAAFANGTDDGSYGGYGYHHMGYGSGYGHMGYVDSDEETKNQTTAGREYTTEPRRGWGYGGGWHRGGGGCWR